MWVFRGHSKFSGSLKLDVLDVRVARAILCYVKSLKLQFLRAANRRS